jgi:hypothetical protein
MLRKGQVRGIEKGDSMKQVAFIASLFATQPVSIGSVFVCIHYSMPMDVSFFKSS